MKGYSGLLGDVHHIKSEVLFNTNIPLTKKIGNEMGIALHMTCFAGYLKNLSKRPSRYYDRFFFSNVVMEVLS